MMPPDPGRVLRRALLVWGLGHLLLGRRATGLALVAAEGIGIVGVAWLTIGLADTSAYLVPFLAGAAFILAWSWQAVAAYHVARQRQPARQVVPDRSPAAAAGWLSLPLLVWGTGFWLVGAHAATPAAVLDRFVTQWSDDALAADDWPGAVLAEAGVASDSLGSAPDRFRDVRIRLATEDDRRATAIAESIHYERRDSRFLGLFAGSELVPVPDRAVLVLELHARSAELPGGGDIGAVRWELVSARAE